MVREEPSELLPTEKTKAPTIPPFPGCMGLRKEDTTLETQSERETASSDPNH